MRNLHLTTPAMRGADVTRAQSLLKAHGYDPATPDGEFGPQTARAAADAKWALGYPAKQVTQVFGPVLLLYLTGKRTPLDYRLRARARARVAGKNVERVEAVLNLAISQIGTKENPPNSNIVRYDAWYGFVGPWCAAFVSWCCEHIKHPLIFKYSYVPSVVGDAQGSRAGLHVVPGPAATTSTLVVACFDWPGESPGIADHIGFTIPEPFLMAHYPALHAAGVAEFGPLGSEDFWTVEGNTGVTNQSNGGEVMLRKRNRPCVQAFVRIYVRN